jgi:hypothetical protein
MIELVDFVKQVVGFDNMPPREKIQIFAWYLQTYKAADTFSYADIRGCYKQLHMPPDQIATYVGNMIKANPPGIIRERRGFKLTRAIRFALDSSHGQHQTTVAVSKLLSDLPNSVPDLVERSFLMEAIKCYRVEAYRACIVMTWNLAFDHLLHWILKDAKRLADFNAAIPKKFPKKPLMTITSKEHFEELKEFEVLEVCSNSNLITGNLTKILKEKLVKRNMSAHPSNVAIGQSQADDVITDLVNNVVLILN